MEPTPARLFPLYDLLSQGAVAFNFNPLDTEFFFNLWTMHFSCWSWLFTSRCLSWLSQRMERISFSLLPLGLFLDPPTKHTLPLAYSLTHNCIIFANSIFTVYKIIYMKILATDEPSNMPWLCFLCYTFTLLLTVVFYFLCLALCTQY